MITGELKSQVDKIWEAFWTGGISNPVIIYYNQYVKRDVQCNVQYIFYAQQKVQNVDK